MLVFLKSPWFKKLRDINHYFSENLDLGHTSVRSSQGDISGAKVGSMSCKGNMLYVLAAVITSFLSYFLNNSYFYQEKICGL